MYELDFVASGYLGPGKSNLVFSDDITLYVGVEIDSLLGDANRDWHVNNLDIAAFVLALTDPEGYARAYPGVDPLKIGDINQDGELNNLDISPFAQLLTSPQGAASVPEPDSIALAFAAAGSLAVLTRSRRSRSTVLASAITR